MESGGRQTPTPVALRSAPEQPMQATSPPSISMSLTRLQPFTREQLLALPVAGDHGLRSLIRREVESGNLSALSGSQIVMLGKEACIALLLGDSAPAAPVSVPRPPQQSTFALSGAIAPGASTPASNGDDAAALFAKAVALLTPSAPLNEDKVRELAHDETVKALNNGAFPVDRVRQIAEEVLGGAAPRRLEVSVNGGPAVEVKGLRHFQFSQVLHWLAAGVPIWLWGGAGAGKTTMARQLAEALGVPAFIVPIDPTTTVGKLAGFRNLATGDFVQGALYEPYKNGGLVCLDEIDTGDAGIIASLNSLLANDSYLFPNGETVKRSSKFYVMAGANTKGTGATGWFKARTQLDGATLDRFACVELKYDTGLELALCTGDASTTQEWKAADYSDERKADLRRVWVRWVQKVREAVGSALLISPRASINGCKAIGASIPVAEIAEALVFKLATSETRAAIIARCGDPARL